QPIGRMHHFGMKLHAVIASLFVGNGGKRGRWRCRHHLESAGERYHPVAMAHPDLFFLPWAPYLLEQAAWLCHLDNGPAEFPVVMGLDLASQLLAHQLL